MSNHRENVAQLPVALYVVATPIGNLQDITVRAIATLRTAPLILCEDTRRAAILCSHYAITAPLQSCHAHNERRSSRRALSELEQGGAVAYISDAGTPAVSDPGARLVSAVRAAGFRVIPIPGASALTTVVSVSGMSEDKFGFVGFLPRRSGKRGALLHTWLNSSTPFVVYESPYRLLKLLQEMGALAPQRKLVLGRELTKIYEEILVGSAQKLLDHFSNKSVRGECVLLVTNEIIE